jgi:hypothetical protein
MIGLRGQPQILKAVVVLLAVVVVNDLAGAERSTEVLLHDQPMHVNVVASFATGALSLLPTRHPSHQIAVSLDHPAKSTTWEARRLAAGCRPRARALRVVHPVGAGALTVYVSP